MPNEINGFRPRPLDTTDPKSAGRTDKAATRGTPAGPAPAATDRVQLTETASRLQELEAMLASTPEVDPARVEALRAAIAEGRYEVDTVHVTDKLIALERSLFGKEKT
jgi:negative regulator of flagellin synthesis FlgM